MRAYISDNKIEALKNFSSYIHEHGADIIFVCSTKKQNAEVIEFDIPVYYLNPKEPIELGVMLQFLTNGNSDFVIFRSEYLTIPDVKNINKILGDNITFFGIFDDSESKKKHLSSYYLDREYK